MRWESSVSGRNKLVLDSDSATASAKIMCSLRPTMTGRASVKNATQLKEDMAEAFDSMSFWLSHCCGA